MSARNRYLGALIGCLSMILSGSPARGQALDSTPRITPGTCPAPHCNLGLWQSDAAVPVYAAPGAEKAAFSLQARVPFEALSGETHAIPGVHVLRGKLDIYDERTSRALGRGDTIRTIADLGEGRFMLEARGGQWFAVMNDRDAALIQTVRPRRETWWVEVKAPDGRRGWIDGGNPGIAGRSFDETAAPLSPASLDSALLAGLTGPVAAIVRERGSTTVAGFETSVEDARGGEGAAWWNAGRLRMLQLRFRTLLTATGTTNPVHSGLPAGVMVCCGDLTYQRLMVFTRREPEYVATITIPDQGQRHVVEAFFGDGRMVRLLRDGRTVPISYADSVMGRSWYSGAKALVQEVAVKAPDASPRPAAESAGPAREGFGSNLARTGLLAGAVLVIVLAGAVAWQWKRRKAPLGKATTASASGGPALPEATAEEEVGWVCPYCHADVLVDTDSCWLCGRERPAEPPPPPRQLICACGEPAAPGAKSCIRCGKSFRSQVF